MTNRAASLLNSASNVGVTVVEKTARADWIIRDTLGAAPQYADRSVAGTTVRFATPSEDEYVRADCAMREQHLLKWWVNRLSKDSVVWDIGAAVGTYAVYAAAVADEVVAFEPHEGNASKLRDNLDLNGLDAEIRQVGLSDEQGDLPFVTSDTMSNGLHRISSDGNETIFTARGDDLKPAPDALKIDVEGHELEVLEGMQSHLEDVNLVLVEVHPGRDVDPSAVRTLLDAAGLSVTALPSPRSEVFLGGVRNGSE